MQSITNRSAQVCWLQPVAGKTNRFQAVLRLVVLLALVFGGIGFSPQKASANLVFDNISDYENSVAGSGVSYTASTPNTFMGGGYLLLTNTTQITGFDIFPVNVSGTDFTGLQINVYVWGSVNLGTVNSSTPAFSDLLAQYTTTVSGAFTSGYYFPFEGYPVGSSPGFSLPSPLVITNNNIGVTFNYQGTTDGVTYSNVNSLTSLIAYGTPPTVGNDDFNGYYRNANSEVNGNFTKSLRSLGQSDQTLALRVFGSVSGANQVPVANPQTLSILTNTSVSITLTATDPDGDPLTYSVVTPPASGLLTGTAPNLVYTPNLNYAGTDAFTFIANDGFTDSAPATVSLSIVDSAGLIINPIFDTSVLSDSNVQSITNTIMTAIHQFELLYANPVTVTIQFDEMSSGLGQSQTWIGSLPYASYYSALVASAATTNDTIALAHLPGGSTDPVIGGSQVTAALPLLRALGFSANPPSGNPDSIISVNMSLINITRPPSNPGNYDLQAVVSHEMDEVLGTSSGVGGSTINPVDLFRYTAEKSRTFTTAGDDAYFSLDGGTNLLARYNQNAGADYGDWWSVSAHTPVRVQDAYGTPNSAPNLSVESTVLDAVGWDLVSALPSIVPVMYPPTLTGTQLTLSWTSISNRNYQVQYTTNLASAVWLNLGSSTNASGPLTTDYDTLTGVQRYYRVQLLGSQSPASPSLVSHPITIIGPITLSTHVIRPQSAGSQIGIRLVTPGHQPIQNSQVQEQ